MKTYIVKFMVNSKTYEQQIGANSPTDAKKAIIAQYSGQKVTIINCKDVKNGWYC